MEASALQENSTFTTKARPHRPLLELFMQNEMRPGWTAAEAAEDFATFIGVIGDASVRELVNEVAPFIDDWPGPADRFAPLGEAFARLVTPEVARAILSEIKAIVEAVSQELD